MGVKRRPLTLVHVTVNDQLVIHREDEWTLEDSFWRFHSENPQVYRALVRLARQWLRKQGGQCGIGMLWEVARWELFTATSGEPIALNNNYRAFYARLMMEREPDLAGLFELRRQRYDRPELVDDE